jgi:methyl-accepting chemotaxis protein
VTAEIAAASREQADGIAELSRALIDIDGVTQQVAANAEETASASEEKAVTAHGLKDIAQGLKILVQGSRRPNL